MRLANSVKAKLRTAWIRSQAIPLGGERFLSWPNLGVIEPRLNLIIIGSGKCGTTSLHEWLGLHPDIFMSRPLKEPGYFAPPGYQGRNRLPNASRTDLMRLMLRGHRNHRYFGEASTIYTAHFVYEHNPNVRIVHDYNPDTRLIYSIRNPFSRIISNYNQDIHRGIVEAAPVIPDDLFERYIRAGSYGHQLAHWAEFFPREQIKVIVLEEFSGDPAPMLRHLTEFLDLKPFPDGLPFKGRNVAAERKRPPHRVALTHAQFEAAQARLLPDIERLERYLGRSVSHTWDMSAAVAGLSRE